MLAYAVRRTDGGPDSVALREVATGDTTKIPLPAGCSVELAASTSILGNGDQVAVDSYCGDHSPTFVVDRTDGIVADLRVESDEGAVQMGDRTVSFYGYAYDLADREAVRRLGPHPPGRNAAHRRARMSGPS